MKELAKEILQTAMLADARYKTGLVMSNLVHLASKECCREVANSNLVTILLNNSWNEALAWAEQNQ